MQRPPSQKSPSQSTNFLGDPQRWATKQPSFPGGFSWINKDAANLNSKAHIAKVRRHIRNEYRNWKPGDPAKLSIPSNESSRSTTPSSPLHSKLTSTNSPLSVSSSEVSSSSMEAVHDDGSPASSLRSPGSSPKVSASRKEDTSLVIAGARSPIRASTTFFDPVRSHDTPIERKSTSSNEQERVNQVLGTRHATSKQPNSAQIISEAAAKRIQSQMIPSGQRSKHEASKLVREVRDYHSKQQALEAHTLKSSIGGLRDDPFSALPTEEFTRRSVIEAADYWVNQWAPAQTPSYVKAGSWKPTSDKVFSVTANDEGAFASQIALARSYLSRNTGGGEEPTKEVLYHQARAMKSLRKHLEAGSVTAAPLLSSLNLLIMSIVHGDRKAYDFHRKGLERMIQTPPTDSNTTLIHAVVQGYFVTSHFYFRLLKLQTRPRRRIIALLLNPPEIQVQSPLLPYPTHPFPPPLSTTIARLPSGFRELALTLSLPTPLLPVLRTMNEWNKAIAPDPTNAKSTQGVAVWFSWTDTEEALDVLEQLLLSSSGNDPADSTVATPLCMVLMLYGIAAHNRFHATKIYARLVRDAVGGVRGFEAVGRAQWECRVWMAVVVCGCARGVGTGNARIETGGLLGEVLGGGGSGSGSGRRRQDDDEAPLDWVAVEGIMKRFFWYEHFAPLWRECWEVEVGVLRS